MFFSRATTSYFLHQIVARRINQIRKMSTEGTAQKKMKTVIGTHDGIFHCDEVLACYMLEKLPQYSGAEILRTRNEELLKDCDIVVDVGSIFDQPNRRFDHHQSSFQHTLSTLRPELGSTFKVRLSSAGLIYTFYGEQVLRIILKEECGLSEVSDEMLRQIYVQVYNTLIQEIDGIDNGVPMFDAEPAYRIHSHLSNRIATYNSVWNEDLSKFDALKQFRKAQQLVGAEFVDKVAHYAKVWWPARTIVQEAVQKRFEVHESGEILWLKQFCPWQNHLLILEADLNLQRTPKYVLFENKPGDFRIVCVPVEPKSFICRKFLHKHWRGLRNEELQKVSGINHALFVHHTGFMGGANSRKGAFQMALQSLLSTVPESE